LGIPEIWTFWERLMNRKGHKPMTMKTILLKATKGFR
jgi:hypothetical protein